MCFEQGQTPPDYPFLKLDNVITIDYTMAFMDEFLTYFQEQILRQIARIISRQLLRV